MVYFAAERTLLSWIRAGASLMALGFVVDRFELFVRYTVAGSPPVPQDFSLNWIGITLVSLGVVATVVAALRYWRFERRYHREGETNPGRGLGLGIFLAVVAAILGIITASILVLTVH